MELTKVVQAQPKSKSLRTTIPAGIARQFGIVEGTGLSWEIRAQANELVLVVRPLPTDGPVKATARARKKPIARSD